MCDQRLGLCLVFAVIWVLAGCGDSTSNRRDVPGGDSSDQTDTEVTPDVTPDGAADTDADGGGMLDGLMSVRIEPLDQTVTATPTVAGTVTFTVFGTFPDGERDITNLSSIRLANFAVGTVSGDLFTSSITQGGTSAISAHAGPLSAETTVTVLLEHNTTGPDGGTPLPADPGAEFGGTLDPALAPQLVYPNDGTMLPPNVSVMEIHWIPAAGTDLFELRFESNTIDMGIFLRCDEPTGGGCIHTLDAQTYNYLARSTGGEGPVSVTVSGSNEAGSFGSSSTFAIEFAQESVQGGVYYWTTSNGSAIMRFDFGAPNIVPEVFVSRDDDPSLGTCVGCHALSRDGRKIVMSKGGQNDGRMVFLADVGRPDDFTLNISDSGDTDHKIQFAAWNPDGSRFAAVYGDTDIPARNRIHFHDGNSGDRLNGERIQLDYEPSHLDWSFDGTMLAVSRVGTHRTSQRPANCGIDVVRSDGMGGWNASTPVVPIAAGTNRCNPSFAPDSSFLIYTEVVCPGGDVNSSDCDCDADPPAKTWAAAPEGNASPIYLGNASGPGVMDGGTDLSDTFARFSPFTQTQGDGRLMWATVSSRRRVGLRDPGGRQLLWMFAVDPDAVAAGQDGSYAAFYLPFQDFNTSNHIGQWTYEVVTNPN